MVGWGLWWRGGCQEHLRQARGLAWHVCGCLGVGTLPEGGAEHWWCVYLGRHVGICCLYSQLWCRDDPSALVCWHLHAMHVVSLGTPQIPRHTCWGLVSTALTPLGVVEPSSITLKEIRVPLLRL